MPSGMMSKTEALKSTRDLLIATVGFVLPQAVGILTGTDFGEYNTLVGVVASALGFFGNRYFNVVRF